MRWSAPLSVRLDKNLIGSIAFEQISSGDVADESISDFADNCCVGGNSSVPDSEIVRLEVDERHWSPETLFTRQIQLAPLVFTRADLASVGEIEEIEEIEKVVVAGAVNQNRTRRTVDTEKVVVARSEEPSRTIDISDLKKGISPDMRRRLNELEEKGQDLSWNHPQNPDLQQKTRQLIAALDTEPGLPAGTHQVSHWPSSKPPVAFPTAPPKYPTDTKGADAIGADTTKTPPRNSDESGPPARSFAGDGIRLEGPVEVFGGLGFTNESRIEVRRISQGVALETGKANVIQGKYSIQVQDLKGVIVGRFYDGKGKVVGEGEINLALMKDFNPAASQAPVLRIEKKPEPRQRVISLYNLDSKKKVSSQARISLHGESLEQRLNEDGVIDLSFLDNSAQYTARAWDRDFMPSLWTATAEDTSDTLIFPEAMVTGFIDFIESHYSMTFDRRRLSIVIGRVTNRGKPIAGAQVSLPEARETAAIYFDGYVPNKLLNATSESGLFAFVNVNEGFTSVVAKNGFFSRGHVNTIVEKGAVGFAAIELSEGHHSAMALPFDAFDGESRDVRFGIQSNEKYFDTEAGQAEVNLANTSRFAIAKVFPTDGEYIPAYYGYNENTSALYFPLIKWDWLKQLRGYQRLSDDARLGVIVGFIDDPNIEIFIPTLAEYAPENVVYFDANGEPSAIPMKGGGFIAFNVPAGFHEVVISSSLENAINSRLANVMPEEIFVINFASKR